MNAIWLDDGNDFVPEVCGPIPVRFFLPPEPSDKVREVFVFESWSALLCTAWVEKHLLEGARTDDVQATLLQSENF